MKSSSKISATSKRFKEYRELIEKSYYAENFENFIKNASRAIESFCEFFIYYSLPNAEAMALEIINGKRDFNNELVPPLKSKPRGKLLIKYIYQSPRSDLLSSINSKFFYGLFEQVKSIETGNIECDRETCSIIRNKLSLIFSLFDELDVQEDIEKRLKNALQNCKKVTEIGYRDAKEQMNNIFRSIAKVNSFLEEDTRKISELKLSDQSLVSQLTSQLRKVQTIFTDEAENANNDIEQKRAATENFNITLFGRTNVGKSTLMEILTNGDGKAIGHGAQRTTKDVRAYKWKGLSVTDVPGIDAYDGKVDEELAERASRFADEIIFIITAGQPENIEAKWLVKLKRYDKPMLCICNVKRTVEDERHLKKFLEASDEILDKEGVIQAIEQFKEFVKQDLPNENIKMIVTHLRSRFLAEQKGYEQYREKLITASRFSEVENSIFREVISNGILYRKKCYLSIIDVPTYNQMCALFEFSAANYAGYLIIAEKARKLKEWGEEYINNESNLLLSKVGALFDKVIRDISSFVDEYMESDDFGERWNNHIKSERIEEKANQYLKSSFDKARLHIENIFSDLDTELRFSKSDFKYTLSGTYIHDYGKAMNWVGAGAGVGGAIFHIAAHWIPGLNVVAIGFDIVSGLGFLTGFFWKSREKRLREKKLEKVREMTEKVSQQKDLVLKKIKYAFIKQVKQGLISEAKNRIYLLQSSLLALVNSQRAMALSYANSTYV